MVIVGEGVNVTKTLRETADATSRVADAVREGKLKEKASQQAAHAPEESRLVDAVAAGALRARERHTTTLELGLATPMLLAHPALESQGLTA